MTNTDFEEFWSNERFFPSSLLEDRRFSRLLEPYGVSYSTYNVLVFLLQHPDGVEPSKIADELLFLRQTMTNIVDSLQSGGYVERAPHPNDRRRILIKLLPAGAQFAGKLRMETRAFHRAVMMNFTKEEMKFYYDIRDRITKAMDEELESALKRRDGK